MYRFGVALMKTDLENAETKLLYDFKDVYPNHGERTTPYVMQPIDENSFAFIYNGKISVFDVKTEGITQTIDFYDKEAFAADDNEIKIRTNKFNDFYYLSGEVLTYAEYKPESRGYVKHDFAVDEKSFYVNRSGNYVYTYRFVGGSAGTGYYNCYDLTTEEAKDGDFLAELVKKLEEQEKERTEEEKQTQKSDSGITVNGKVYRIEKSVFGEPEIINEAGEVVFMIDDDYAAKNNEKLTQLFGVYFSCENGLNADFAFKVFDNRLFIVVSRSALLFETPDFIFEFDFATSNLKYVTYVYGDFEFYKLAAK